MPRKVGCGGWKKKGTKCVKAYPAKHSSGKPYIKPGKCDQKSFRRSSRGNFDITYCCPKGQWSGKGSYTTAEGKKRKGYCKVGVQTVSVETYPGGHRCCPRR